MVETANHLFRVIGGVEQPGPLLECPAGD
jgi:hypothetical protein